MHSNITDKSNFKKPGMHWSTGACLVYAVYYQITMSSFLFGSTSMEITKEMRTLPLREK